MKKPTFLVRVGQIVRELRGTRTQDEIAKKAGISRSILSNIENGRNWEGRNLAKILAVLGADIDSLFDVSGAMDRERQLHQRLNELLRADDPWPTVIAFNVDSVYSYYVAHRRPDESLIPPTSSMKPR